MTASCWSPCRHRADAEERSAGDFIGSQGGYIHVVGTGRHRRHRQQQRTLDLTGNTTIDGGGTLNNPAMFTVSGLLGTTAAATPSRTSRPPAISPMTASCRSTNAGTVLTLKNDQLQDFIGSQGGYIQVVGTGNGTGVTASNSATLDLTGNTTIDGGGTLNNPAMFTVSGLLGTTAAATPLRTSPPPAISPMTASCRSPMPAPC